MHCARERCGRSRLTGALRLVACDGKNVVLVVNAQGVQREVSLFGEQAEMENFVRGART